MLPRSSTHSSRSRFAARLNSGVRACPQEHPFGSCRCAPWVGSGLDQHQSKSSMTTFLGTWSALSAIVGFARRETCREQLQSCQSSALSDTLESLLLLYSKPWHCLASSTTRMTISDNLPAGMTNFAKRTDQLRRQDCPKAATTRASASGRKRTQLVQRPSQHQRLDQSESEQAISGAGIRMKARLCCRGGVANLAKATGLAGGPCLIRKENPSLAFVPRVLCSDISEGRGLARHCGRSKHPTHNRPDPDRR